MALYAIGDLHLSLTADKPMEVFGPAWENYTERIGDALSRLTAGDVLVLAGDTSWGIDLNEAEADFRFLRRCIRATSARRSCGCSRPTPWSGAATATSTATPSNGGWRAGGMGRTSP